MLSNYLCNYSVSIAFALTVQFGILVAQHQVHLVQTVSGEVGPSNYTYYEWANRDKFPIHLVLTSVSGKFCL